MYTRILVAGSEKYRSSEISTGPFDLLEFGIRGGNINVESSVEMCLDWNSPDCSNTIGKYWYFPDIRNSTGFIDPQIPFQEFDSYSCYLCQVFSKTQFDGFLTKVYEMCFISICWKFDLVKVRFVVFVSMYWNEREMDMDHSLMKDLFLTRDVKYICFGSCDEMKVKQWI